MHQVKKSHSCGISAIFFQCCFITEIQLLMTVSNFGGFFSRNHFLEGSFTFQWEGCFSDGGPSFLSGGKGGGHHWGHHFWWEGFSKKIAGWEGHPPLWEHCFVWFFFYWNIIKIKIFLFNYIIKITTCTIFNTNFFWFIIFYFILLYC